MVVWCDDIIASNLYEEDLADYHLLVLILLLLLLLLMVQYTIHYYNNIHYHYYTLALFQNEACDVYNIIQQNNNKHIIQQQ